jgi:lipopolysaccharide export system protein LptA
MSHKNFILFVLIGSMWFSFFDLPAQIRHRSLREEVLTEQQKTKTETADPTQKELTTPKKTKSKKLEPLEPVAPIKTPFDQKTAKIIYLENADLVNFDQRLRPDVQILNGNVKFRHDDAVMTCDSAYLYKNNNSLDAFSNVKIVQGDTLFVYGDKLYYDGNTKLVRLRGKAKLVNRNTTLTTDSLNYDRTTQLAYYFTGGKIVDPENTLTSVWGQYSTATEDALFSNKVKLVNENFVMDADTLTYNTKTHIADLVGDTHIVYHDETDIYTRKGWYNTETEKSMLLNRSYLTNKEGKYMTGDTIFYDKKKNYGEIFGKAVLNDSIQKSSLLGNYVYYHEEDELGIATDSALLVDWSTEQTLYVHADTLKTYKDSIYNEAEAWRNVRFYREDVQGIADSLIYSSRDSVMHLVNEPVVWQENQQFSSKTIHIYSKNQELEKIHLEHAAMIIEQVDSAFYNQISGKDITAFLDSSELKRLEVNGNAETVYFIRDEHDNSLLGANRTESSYVTFHFKDRKMDKTIFPSATTGEFHPIEMVTDDFMFLSNYFWLDTHRPLSKDDVFKHFPKAARTKTSAGDDMKSDNLSPPKRNL